MIRRTKLMLAGVPALALTVGASLGLAAPASAGLAAAKPSGSAVVTNGAQTQAAAHWTKAQMRAAKPMKIAVRSAKTAGPVSVPQMGGTPGAVAGFAGTAAARASVAPAAAVPQAGGFTYPTPFTRYEVEKQLWKVYPQKAVGKLFFTQNGLNYVCSAAAISASQIWTAGHCAADGASHWSTNVVFVPAYRDGVAPYGQFSCPTLTTSTAWFASGDLTADFAKAACGTSSTTGKTFKVTGWLGFAWNWGYGLHYDDFGYPQAAPFNGARLQRCESSFGHTDTRMSGTPSPQAIGCDMTGGSSGGPWIWQLNTGNYINGENSYKYVNPAEPLEMYSPYYGDLAYAVYTA